MVNVEPDNEDEMELMQEMNRQSETNSHCNAHVKTQSAFTDDTVFLYILTRKRATAFALLCFGLLAALLLAGCSIWPLAGAVKVSEEAASQKFPRFAVSFPAKLHPEPVTGRVLLFFSRSGSWEPRYAFNFFDLQPVFAIDVKDLRPGTPVVFCPKKFYAPNALAFPGPLDKLESGIYYVQALFDLDRTRPDFNIGPGNLYSRMVKFKLDISRHQTVKLTAYRAVKNEPPPKDTDWVKLVEIRSNLLSDFHGRDVKLRAAVILPAAYADKPDQQFPTVYTIPGFGGDYTYAWWYKDGGDRKMIQVALDPEVPMGHSVFANSANNGPVGDALIQELIPEIEKRFRAIPHAYGRFVTGHSSGGWASLWLQVDYPDFFGSCWSLSPDPVDFRHFQTMNIYKDHNGHWTMEGYPRPLARNTSKVAATFGEVNRWEYVVGYGYQLDSFNAVFSQRGANGQPRPLMDKLTGAIDPEVAEHWKRYDIRHILEENWASLGPKLKGKLHIIVGAWDTYYLETGVEGLQDFLKTTEYDGYVEILPGDHGSFWSEQLQDRIDREMAEHLTAGEKAFYEAHPKSKPTAK
jgi:S-formylglutathione hydrolase FrmB